MKDAIEHVLYSFSAKVGIVPATNLSYVYVVHRPDGTHELLPISKLPDDCLAGYINYIFNLAPVANAVGEYVRKAVVTAANKLDSYTLLSLYQSYRREICELDDRLTAEEPNYEALEVIEVKRYGVTNIKRITGNFLGTRATFQITVSRSREAFMYPLETASAKATVMFLGRIFPLEVQVAVPARTGFSDTAVRSLYWRITDEGHVQKSLNLYNSLIAANDLEAAMAILPPLIEDPACNILHVNNLRGTGDKLIFFAGTTFAVFEMRYATPSTRCLLDKLIKQSRVQAVTANLVLPLPSQDKQIKPAPAFGTTALWVGKLGRLTVNGQVITWYPLDPKRAFLPPRGLDQAATERIVGEQIRSKGVVHTNNNIVHVYVYDTVVILKAQEGGLTRLYGQSGVEFCNYELEF